MGSGLFLVGKFIECTPYSKSGITKYRTLIACSGTAYSVTSLVPLDFNFGDDVQLMVSVNAFKDKAYFNLKEG